MSSNLDGDNYVDESWAIRDLAIICKQCHPTCLTCSLPYLETKCITCHSLLFQLTNGECICLDGLYLDIQNPCTVNPCAVCAPCHTSCSKCFGPGPQNCIACKAGFFFQDNFCFICPSNTYYDDGDCIICHENCQTCSGPLDTDCLTCLKNTYLNSNNQCANSCPANFVQDSSLSKCLPNTVVSGSRFFDQESYSDSDVNALGILTFTPQTPETLTSMCGGVKAFGVENLFGDASLQVSIQFAALPARDSVRIKIAKFFALGTWASSDLIQVFLNGNNNIIVFSQTGYLANQTEPPYHCASGPKVAISQYYEFAFPDKQSSATDVNITFQLTTSKPASQLSFAMQDISAETFKCHPYCASCFDTTASSCLSCAAAATLNATTHTCHCLKDEYLKQLVPCVSSPCSQCTKCISPCQECYHNNEISCISCIENYFYAPQISYCVIQCPSLQYIPDIPNLQCIECTSPCRFCIKTTITCLSCIKNYYYDQQNYQCVTSCQNGTYPDNLFMQCELCDSSCSTCIGPLITHCTNCKTSFFLNTDQDGSKLCKPCYILCSQCNGFLKTQCLACIQDAIYQDNICTKDCLEFQSTYPDLGEMKCKQCNPICKECFGGTDLDCYQCQNNYFLKNRVCTQCHDACHTCTGPLFSQCQSCQPTYYFKPISSCIKCPENCNLCTGPKTCQSCQENRVGTLCDCSMPFGIDYLGISLICGTCQIALAQIQFSENWAQIYIDFDFEVTLIGFESDQEDSTSILCTSLFPTPLLAKIGSGAKCQLNPNIHNGIAITIDGTATILPGQIFSFNSNAIKQKDCSNGENINQLINAVLEQAQGAATYRVALDGPIGVMPICRVMEIKMVNISNDGHRGPKNATWTLFSITPDSNNTHKSALESLLYAASQQNSLTITLPSLFLLEGRNYVFQLISYSWFEQSQLRYFTIETGFSQQIFLEVKPTGKLITKRSADFSAWVFFQIRKCISATEDVIVNDQLNYFWNQTQGTPSYGLNTNIQQSQIGQNNSELFLPALIGTALQSYTFTFTAMLINMPVNNSISLTVSIIQTPLILQIGGGSRVASFQDDFKIYCTARDPDIPANSSDPYKDMLFEWSCTDLNTYEACKDQLGNVITIPPPSISNINLTFVRKTFLPYKSYQFTVTLSKDNRQATNIVVIMFQEFDLPQLALDIPDNLLSRRINLNDEMFMRINYSNTYNTDTLFYSATFIYQFNEVAALVFKYVDIRFQIWEKFINFTTDETLVVRFSVYNPIFMMPSMMAITLKVNRPPFNCVFSVSSAVGISLVTDFTFTINGCIDIDQPLNYKFFIYKSYNDSLQEIINPINVLRTMMTDFTSQNTLTTKLPQGLDEYVQNCTIMASVQDYNKGLTNLTLNVTINKNNLVVANDNSSYLTVLESLYQQVQWVNKTLSEQVRLYSLIILDFSRSKILDHYNPQFIAFKKLLFDALQTLYQGSASGTAWEVQITQLIDMLMINSAGLVFQYTATELGSKLDNLDSIIQSSGGLLFTVPVGNRDENQARQAAKLDTSLLNVAGALNGILKGVYTNQTKISKTDFSAEANTTRSDSDLLNKKIVNQTQSISALLTVNSLPNETPKKFNGDSILIQSQLITPKYLDSYLGNDNSDWSTDTDNANDTNNNINQTGNSSIVIYQVAFQYFQDNPYVNDPNFPNTTLLHQVIDPAIYQQGSNFSEKINITEKIKHTFSVPCRNNTDTCSNNQTRRQLQKVIGQQSQFKCIQLQMNASWSPKTCDKAELKQPDGSIAVKCFCKDLSATSITEDFVNIFENNPNVQNIIDISQGLDMISNMEWQKYVIFYFGVFFTLFWLRLIYYGIIKDLNQSKIFEIKQPDKSSQFEKTNQKEQDNNKIANNVDKSDQKLIMTNEQVITDKMDSAVDQNNNQQSNNRFNRMIINDEQKSDIITIDQPNKDQIKDYEKRKAAYQKALQLENIKEDDKFTQFAIGSFSYHEFMSVFHQYDPKLSRPVRFTIYYIKIVFLMASTAIFSGFLNFVQTILFAILSGVTFSFIIALLTQLLKRNAILKLIGIIMLLAVMGICWYSSLVVAASRGIYDSNMWAIQFISTYIIDNVVVQICQGAVKYSILIYMLDKKDKFVGLMQTISSVLIKVLMNEKLKMMFGLE